MAGNQPSDGQGSAAHFVASHKDELYDIMYRIKALDEQDPELARQFLIENPTITRHLFQVGSSHLGPEDSSHAESSRASKRETSMDAWLWELLTARMGKAVGPLAAHH